MLANKIAVIGAGWRGIGFLRILKEHGYEIDVYEKNDDIGGVWHPVNNYVDLKIHQPAAGIEFFDFPLPAHIDKSQTILSIEVYNYLKEYCNKMDLYRYIKFNVNVLKIAYFTHSNTAMLSYQEANDTNIKSKKYDYIIFTGGFSRKYIPIISGSDIFKGQILHSFDATRDKIDQLIAAGKKITVVGGSKSAVDLICYFNKINYPLTWLYRSTYWFASIEPFQLVIKNKLEPKKFKVKSKFWSFVYSIALLIVLPSPLLSWRFLNLFGVFKNIDPSKSSINKFHGGIISREEFSTLLKSAKQSGVYGEIVSFADSGIHINDGHTLTTDVVIFCTGTGNKDKIMDIDIDGSILSFADTILLYRGKVIPQLPHIIFTASRQLIPGTSNALSEGMWIDNYIKNPLSKDYLRDNAEVYDTSFFIKQTSFVENENTFVSISKGLKSYLYSGELDWFDVKRASWDSWFGVNGVKPMRFKSPRK